MSRVVFKNSLNYIQPQSAVNDLTREVQQSFNTYQKGASKTFANYYGGSGDTREFVWTAKPPPPVATSMDRLGSDFDRNHAITSANNKKMFNIAEGIAGQKAAYFNEIRNPSTSKGFKRPVSTWFRNVKYDLRRERVSMDIANMYRQQVIEKHRLPGYFKHGL
jgi:hypothetical protein